MNEIIVCEYIWLDGRGGLRSKTRVLTATNVKNVGDLPVWNYDGSSTWQANSDGNTEVLLTPVFMCADPLRPDINGLLVLCETSKETSEETSEGSDSCFATKGSDSCEATKETTPDKETKEENKATLEKLLERQRT